MQQPERPSLSVENVSHRFADGLEVLVDVNLSIPTNGFVALVGPSGVGKSTLLRILGGLLTPTGGRVQVANGAGGEEDSIGIVFQRDNLMPWRTAYDNVRLPLELQGISEAKSRARVNEMLALVGLAGFEQSYPAQLSGGMAQRVALARALVHRPALLLLDEPFGSLDALTRERMGEELLRIWQAMTVTVFMVTHSITEAVLLADEVLVMNRVRSHGAATITQRLPVRLARPRGLQMQGTAVFYEQITAVRRALQME